MSTFAVQGVRMSFEAYECALEVGADVQADVRAIRQGLSPEKLYEECLDGANPDREQGWRDYVSAVATAAERGGLW